MTKFVYQTNLGEKETQKNLQEEFRQEVTFESADATGPRDGNGPMRATEVSTIHLGPNNLVSSSLTASKLDSVREVNLVSAHHH